MKNILNYIIYICKDRIKEIENEVLAKKKEEENIYLIISLKIYLKEEDRKRVKWDKRLFYFKKEIKKRKRRSE